MIMKTLPLHSFHQSKGAKFAPFAGWEMPISYGSSIDEHLRTRRTASFFDVSHMGEIVVKGKEATEFLSFVLTQNITKFPLGKGIYSPLCNPNGGTIDDLICYKIDEESYFLCVNASNIEKDVKHLQKHLEKFECEVEDVSANFGQIAVQGPVSEEILCSIFGENIRFLKKMDFKNFTFNETEIMVARTGYTGEDGFELYCDRGTVRDIAAALDETGLNMDVSWAGLAARDSLRLEAGFPLYGHELSETISPLQAGLKWSVDLNKTDFIGKNALTKEWMKNDKQLVKYFRVKGRRIPRTGCEIYQIDSIVGEVLSGGFSPSAEQPMGSALFTSGSEVKIGDTCFADVRGTRIEITIGHPILKELNKG